MIIYFILLIVAYGIPIIHTIPILHRGGSHLVVFLLGGSENKGAVDGFILSHENWKKLIAQKDIIFSNSIVEAVNKIMKRACFEY